MFCSNCKVEMTESTTVIEAPGKDITVKVLNVPCSVCPQCNACIVDTLPTGLAQKAASKSKDVFLDFDKIRGIGVLAGKI